MKIGKKRCPALRNDQFFFYFFWANILWKTSWGLGDILSTKQKKTEMLTEVIKLCLFVFNSCCEWWNQRVFSVKLWHFREWSAKFACGWRLIPTCGHTMVKNSTSTSVHLRTLRIFSSCTPCPWHYKCTHHSSAKGTWWASFHSTKVPWTSFTVFREHQQQTAHRINRKKSSTKRV